MSLAPLDKAKVVKFCDYILDNYISDDSKIPPEIRAEMINSTDRTTNCREFFHSKFNDKFYSKLPDIFNFIDVFLGNQIDTYTKFNTENRRQILPKDKRRIFYSTI